MAKVKRMVFCFLKHRFWMELGIPVKIFHRKQFEKSNIRELVIHLWVFSHIQMIGNPYPSRKEISMEGHPVNWMSIAVLNLPWRL